MKEVLKSLKDLLSKQKLLLEDAKTDIRMSQRVFLESKKQMNKDYLKYKSEMEKMDETIRGYEDSIDKLEFTNERKNTVLVCINESLKNCKESEKTYKIHFFKAKEARADYIKKLKQEARKVQEMEETRIELLKTNLMEMLNEEEELNIKRDIKLDESKETISKLNKDIEIQSIIKNFNIESKTIEDIEFRKVTVKANEILKKFDAYYTRGGNPTPFDFEAARNAVLTGIEEGKDKRTHEFENTFATILDHCWNDKDIDSLKLKQYKEIIKDKDARKIFFECLNHYRKNGIFCMSIKAFSVLSNLLHELLTVIEATNDIECALSLIILSQTYYYEQKEAHRESIRIYLQERIVKHSLFQGREFWQQVLEQPLSKHAASSISEDETTEERKYRLENELFIRAATYAHNMLQFKHSKEVVEDTIFAYVKKCNLSEAYINSIKVMFLI